MVKDIYLVIDSIDLLTIEEVQKLPKDIRSIGQWYWLQPSRDGYDWVSAVTPGGFIYSPVIIVEDSSIIIRPALLIENLDSLNLPLYTELEIFDKDWIYIGNNKALCKHYLWRGRFDANSYNYATSEIKQKLDAWLEEQKARFNED